jgi:hypothetical protein
VEPLTTELGEESGYLLYGAIAIAEAFARGDSLDHSVPDKAARAAGRASDVVLYGSALASTIGAHPAHAARAAWAAAECARAAYDATRTESDLAIAFVVQAAQAADNAATAAGSRGTAAAARADLSRLLGLNLGGPGELGRPIDVSEIGPLGRLWPKDPPDWFFIPLVRPPGSSPEPASARRTRSGACAEAKCQSRELAMLHAVPVRN